MRQRRADRGTSTMAKGSSRMTAEDIVLLHDAMCEHGLDFESIRNDRKFAYLARFSTEELHNK